MMAFFKRIKQFFLKVSGNRVLEPYSAAAMAEGSQDMAMDYLDYAFPEEAEVNQLRLEFKTRYNIFKNLLQANNSALENMACIEKALQDSDPFSIYFIRKKVLSVTVDVFRMIRNLDEIAPHKYKRLYDRFNEIQKEIDQSMTPQNIVAGKPMILPLDKVDHKELDLVGNKMAKLAEIKNQLGLRVPDGFVITASAYRYFIDHNDLQNMIDKQLQEVDFDTLSSVLHACSHIQQMILESDLPKALEEQIESAFNRLQGNRDSLRIAMRSSAFGEDTIKTSFAGQYESLLNIGKDKLIAGYKNILASKYSLQAVIYRFNRGLRGDDIAMCVGCMEMLDTLAGGVAYSQSPVDLNEKLVYIDSCWGLPKTVVEGNSECDHFRVSRKSPFSLKHQVIKNKATALVWDGANGNKEVALDAEKQNKASIDTRQSSSIAEIAVSLEEYYQGPQDVEWGITPDGTIHILQCRPLLQRKSAEQTAQNNKEITTDETPIAKGGISACPGSVWGPVYHVETKTDLLNFPNGAILLVSKALPRWAPALNKAIAVISETGGFAGHLANVAREFDLPAIFGLPKITTMLKNGDYITLDADNQAIYKEKIEVLLSRKKERKKLMEGSPVYESLSAVSRHIVPLHLLDPDSVNFRPAYCTTLHDITRFIHEKSVTEMFNFGKSHHFSERSAKQLYYKVPMQWWVLNLDDGYYQEIRGKYVTLEDISSIPMLALWEGMIAFPWEGPPPIDGRGFLSVMLQATANTTLTTSGRSGFVDKNYFMITRNFCNLASRLGFHFTTVESMVSEDVDENYISFQYKGGAADYKRRLSRVKFLGEVLEPYQFNVELRKDTLIARLENQEMDFMTDRLKILGYLMIHTRQIDMIMMNPNSVRYYQSKFKEQISTLLGTVSCAN